jgi:hypothetical protein
MVTCHCSHNSFIIDEEKAQWTLAPNQKEDAATTAEERQPKKEDAATTAEEIEPQKEDAAITAAAAAEPQAEEREPKPKPTKLSENNHSVLYAKLAKHSAEWREIGIHLGFCPSELNEIQARPPLYTTAPKSLLSAMIADWLQWAPGDQRGSTNYATLEGLRDAVNKAGLSEAAQSITTEILKPTAS